MNPYARIGALVGTSVAMALCARLAAWHDAMVAHERRLRGGPRDRGCGDECPHAEARELWAEAVEAFGPRAQALAFLRACGDVECAAGLDVSPCQLEPLQSEACTTSSSPTPR